MIFWLCILCFVLFIVCIALMIKLILMRKAAKEIRLEFANRLKSDTNVGIDLSSRDSRMQKLAADIDWQLKLLRREHIRYVRGDQELRHAITNISHDLRTPLTAICGYMELLLKEDISDTVRRYLNIVEHRIKALKDMTEELFQYSVILSVDTYKEKKRISLNRALEECLAEHYGALKAAGIEPEITMPNQMVYCQLNEQALSRILQNLVSNVIKYSDGDLGINLEQNGSIQFRNHTDRLDEVQVGHLFDRFYTVESGRKSTGLGLSIAKTLTEEMGGKIEAWYKDEVLTITINF